MLSYLITGCTRGLGLALVKELVLDKQNLVFATGRNRTTPGTIQNVIDQSSGNINYVYLDTLDSKSIQNAVEQVRNATKGHGLDILVNNAAVQVEGAEPATEANALSRLFESNVISVYNVTTAFLPLLKIGREKKIVNITSELGSIGLSRSMAFIPKTSYKVSKAALNMLTVQYAYELESEGFTIFCMNPGHLQTDLGGGGAELPVEVGARAVTEVIQQASHEDNAQFKNINTKESKTCDGQNIPW